MQKNEHWITPTWPAAPQVKALTTLRIGGVSAKPFDSFNLGDHVGDDPTAVSENRSILKSIADLPQEPCWLSQVHGTTVIDLADYASLSLSSKHPLSHTHTVPIADASISFKQGQVAVVLSGDCLPILFCDKKGTPVAAVHAGWRGLAKGIIQETVTRLDCNPADLLVWMGPAIGPSVYEVGLDFKEAFTMEGDNGAFQIYVPLADQKKSLDLKPDILQSGTPLKWKADLYMLARVRLQHLGITQIYGGEYCTFTEKDRFFSARQSNPTGRQATLIWLEV